MEFQLGDLIGVIADTNAEAGRRAVVVCAVRPRMGALTEDVVPAEGVVAVARHRGVVEPAGHSEAVRQIQVSVVWDEDAAPLFSKGPGRGGQMRGVRIDQNGLPELTRLSGSGEGRHLAVETRVAR